MRAIFGTLKYGCTLSLFGWLFVLIGSIAGVALGVYGWYALALYELTGYLFMGILGCGFFVCGVYFLVKDILQRIRLRRCLEDSVRLVAKFACKNKTAYVWERDWGLYKLLVSFEYNGKLVKKESGTKPTNGYRSWIGIDLEGEHEILYSPKYDEVILLKREKISKR